MLTSDMTNWRRQERARLLEARRSLPAAERVEATEGVLRNLGALLADLHCATLGVYWPIKREIDIRRFGNALSQSRRLRLALPVVVAKGQPLEYWRWRMADPMTRGFWNIPVPETRNPVDPDVVIAPLVGFSGCFRLGYGGGYFDRTLAARRPKPVAIGIGFEFSRLDDFAPHRHDIPMDFIVTERSILVRGRDVAQEGNRGGDQGRTTCTSQRSF